MSKKKATPATTTPAADPQWEADLAKFKKYFEYLGQALAIQKMVEIVGKMSEPGHLMTPWVHPRLLELVQATDGYAYEMLTEDLTAENVKEGLECLVEEASVVFLGSCTTIVV